MPNQNDDKLGELAKLISLLRRNGVESFDGLGYKLSFAEESIRKPRSRAKEAQVDAGPMRDMPSLSEEQLLFYSSGIPDGTFVEEEDLNG